MTVYYAHSTPKADKSDWQLLPAHLASVAEVAAEFGRPLGIGRAARLAGLLHDLGKFNPAFQAYIAGSGTSVDHSTAGAYWACELAKMAAPLDRRMAEIVAYAIAGHHAGLPDRQEGRSSLASRLQGYKDVLDLAWRNDTSPEISALFPALSRLKASKDDPTARGKAAFQFAMIGRMIFSCLVDADFRDTERFYAANEGREIDRSWPSLASLLDHLVADFDAHMAQFQPTGEVNRLRADILTHARSKASLSPGLFTLSVPTGGGKTLASLGFALDHAKHHRLRRIIYAIPFTSIIDQTAAIFKEVLGDGVVLEHHSAIEDERSDRRDVSDADSRDEEARLRRAMEDWEAPVVVTTNVQFFESLFASRASRARKLHNLAGSVIVLDGALIETRRSHPGMAQAPHIAPHAGAWIEPRHRAGGSRVGGRSPRGA